MLCAFGARRLAGVRQPSAYASCDVEQGFPVEPTVTQHGNGNQTQRLLNMAKTVRSWRPYQSRYAVKAIIHDRFRTGLDLKEPQVDCTESDIFEAAYGDPDGREYWDSWLFERMPARDLADLVATHSASSEAELAKNRSNILRALESEIQKHPRDAAEWLAQNPNTRHLVSDSLRRHLSMRSERHAEQLDVTDLGTSARIAKKNVGGRPPKWDWVAFDGEVVRIANTPNGLPDRTILKQKMVDWCEREWGDSPADSTVRDRISRLYPPTK